MGCSICGKVNPNQPDAKTCGPTHNRKARFKRAKERNGPKIVPWCAGKKEYDTFDEAREVAEKATAKYGRAFRVFRCPECMTSYHVQPRKPFKRIKK